MTFAEQRPADLPAWPSPAVEQLCGEDAHFERVPADEAFARSVLEQVADDGEVLLFAAARGHWAKAHTLSYDAARKSVEALLLARGWRSPAAAAAPTRTTSCPAWSTLRASWREPDGPGDG